MSTLTQGDIQVLRELCTTLLTARETRSQARAASQENWTRPNRLQPGRPAVVTLPDLSCWDAELVPDSSLRCQGAEARGLEKTLRQQLFMTRCVADDSDPCPQELQDRICRIPKAFTQTDWGLPIQWSERTEEGGAWAFRPVIEGPEDLKKLKQPIATYDPDTTQRTLELHKEAFGDLYEGYEIDQGAMTPAAFHLTGLIVMWRGLGNLMMDLYDNPQMIHDLMGFLTEAHQDLIRQWTDQGLLKIARRGGYSATPEMLDRYDGQTVRPENLWAWTEAQELTQVSPDQHWEFSMAYESKLVENFGLSSYGCCEDLTNKIDHLRRIPNLRTIGVTPFANVPRCVDQIGLDYVISWRPHPGYFAAPTFNEAEVRAYFREHLETLSESAVQIALKDIQTVQNEPDRLTRLTTILQEEIDRVWGESTNPGYPPAREPAAIEAI